MADAIKPSGTCVCVCIYIYTYIMCVYVNMYRYLYIHTYIFLGIFQASSHHVPLSIVGAVRRCTGGENRAVNGAYMTCSQKNDRLI